MKISLVLLFIIFAGFINGSYAAPLKYIRRWPEEVLWFAFSFFGFIIFPWITVIIFSPDLFTIISVTYKPIIFYLIIGGLLFGIGQVCYSIAFRLIGISLNCVINISVGTLCTALAGLFLKPYLFGTLYCYLQILGTLIFIFAMILGAITGKIRSEHSSTKVVKDNAMGCIKKISLKNLTIGVVLASCAGIGIAGEGISYMLSIPTLSRTAISLGDRFISANVTSWVIIFTVAWIPYVLYFLIMSLKNRTIKIIFNGKTTKYWLFLIVMGACYWFALIIFGWTSKLMGNNLAPTVGWPLFMIFIILTSNFWGWFQGEWKGTGSLAIKLIGSSIVFLILAIIVFSVSSYFLPQITF